MSISLDLLWQQDQMYQRMRSLPIAVRSGLVTLLFLEERSRNRKIDGNNWEEEVAQAAAVLALEQLKDWATAPSFEGQVNSADRLFLQLQRIHELFPPNDKKKSRKHIRTSLTKQWN